MRFNPYSAGIDISCQNLTSKVDPRTLRIKYNGCRPKTYVFKWVGKNQLGHL